MKSRELFAAHVETRRWVAMPGGISGTGRYAAGCPVQFIVAGEASALELTEKA